MNNLEDGYALKMLGVTKEYSGNRVLDNVSFTIQKGEIHALLGENGAGKSTLMNILFGMSVIHSTGGFTGEIYVDGEKASIDSPQKAMELGIGMVHQEFMLLPGYTVTENVKVGREITKPGLMSRVFGKPLEKLDMKAMAADTRVALDKVGLNVDEYVRVAGMPVGYMQFVEIAREIDKTAVKLLVFDEPTAVLTESEAERLMECLVNISQKGIAIVFITHRLDEVMSISDNVTILRDGKVVASKAKKDTNKIELAELMIGRAVERYADEKPDSDRTGQIASALRIRDLTVQMEGEEIKGLDLDIQEGEIFGIGGLAGQGKIGIFNGIMGLAEANGSVEVFGEKLSLNTLGAALSKGIAFVSEDRRGVGLLLDEPISYNIMFTAMRQNRAYLQRFVFFTQLDKRRAQAYAQDMIKEFDIRCTGPGQAVGRLSGGNQQKVCLARAIAQEPRMLFVSEPTRGIDIGAKKIVLDKLVQLNRDTGMTVVMASSELAELRAICDRIAIVAGGKLAAILKPDAPDAEFGLAMSGEKMDGLVEAVRGAGKEVDV